MLIQDMENRFEAVKLCQCMYIDYVPFFFLGDTPNEKHAAELNAAGSTKRDPTICCHVQSRVY